MKNETIHTASVYTNFQGKLHIGIKNETITGRTLCANLSQSDTKMFIKKEISIDELVEKYFHFENGKVKYTNPRI